MRGHHVRVQNAALLSRLLSDAGLPEAVRVERLEVQGLDNEIHVVWLPDGRRVVLRRPQGPRELDAARAHFLEARGVPAPRQLAESTEGALYEVAPGEVLGDLLEQGRCTDEIWRWVGAAYRRVHDVRFPVGLAGRFGPRELVLHAEDPAARMHAALESRAGVLHGRAPEAVGHFPALHAVINRAASSLRAAETSLLHGDVNMWNIVVDERGGKAWLVDWDCPEVGASAVEVALLDKHAWLCDGRGLGAAFFEGYGRPRLEPNVSVYRVVETVLWAGSGDWESFERMSMPVVVRQRLRRWLETLVAYARRLPEHIERLNAVV